MPPEKRKSREQPPGPDWTPPDVDLNPLPPVNTGPTPQEIMLQVLAQQGIDTPEKLGQFFTNVGALSGQVKDLQDQLAVLQEKKKAAASLDQEVDDLKNISAKGREIQELRKVFQSSSPVELAIASRMLMPQDEGKAIQALQEKIRQLEQANADERHRQDMRDLSDRMSGEISRLESQVLNLQATLAQQPTRGSAIDELKGIVENYKKLQADLEGLGLTTKKEGGVESLAMRALDRVGGKIMDVAEKYGLIDFVLTGHGSQQGAGRPPPPPTDKQGKPYDQNEFNNAAIVWLRDVGSKLAKDQVMIDDNGFIMGYGEHIHRYLAQRRPQGIQPYITPDNHYVVPNTISQDYLVWARQNVPQQPGPPPTGPGAQNGSRPATGF